MVCTLHWLSTKQSTLGKIFLRCCNWCDVDPAWNACSCIYVHIWKSICYTAVRHWTMATSWCLCNQFFEGLCTFKSKTCFYLRSRKILRFLFLSSSNQGKYWTWRQNFPWSIIERFACIWYYLLSDWHFCIYIRWFSLFPSNRVCLWYQIIHIVGFHGQWC